MPMPDFLCDGARIIRCLAGRTLIDPRHVNNPRSAGSTT
jgi:hypothetical protein